MIYLASPYSGSAQLQIDRAAAAADCAAALFAQGLWCISPIVHWHQTALRFGLKSDADMFRAYNHSLLSICFSLYVLQISGWKESKGVQLEILWARDLNKPIKRVLPNANTYLIQDWK